MYTTTKRRAREAEKRIERHHYKFISDYVNVLHNDIYKKAEELYQCIRQKYPDGVKDLTKTFEYMNTVTPHKQVPRYYMSRKTKEESTNEKRMVLEIPLLPPSAVAPPQPVASPPYVAPPQPVASPPHVAPPQPVASPPHVAPPQPVASPPHVAPPQPVASPPHVAPPQPVASPPPDVSLPPLSEEVVLQLLQDLHQDPDLSKILNGFPLDDDSMMDTTTDLHPDIWDTIRPQDILPLEQELCNVLM